MNEDWVHVLDGFTIDDPKMTLGYEVTKVLARADLPRMPAPKMAATSF